MVTPLRPYTPVPLYIFCQSLLTSVASSPLRRISKPCEFLIMASITRDGASHCPIPESPVSVCTRT